MDRFILSNWTQNDYNSLILFLKSQADLSYREFHKKLIPDAETDLFIGIRLPIMRKIAKTISKGNIDSFLSNVGNDYYEEDMLYGLVLNQYKSRSFEDFCLHQENFIKRISNWAVCDTCSGKSKDFYKFKEDYFSYIEDYFYSENPWKVRYALIVMFQYKKDKAYHDIILKRLNNINNDHYYVKMAKAWLTAELYVFDSDKIYNFLQKNNFDKETMKMTFQKMSDSYRISAEDKAKLRNLKKFCLTTK